MEILIKVLQLLLSLSIMVILHEMGHFLTAKLFKTRVEKFYLFFDPWFSVFKKKVGETEYGIGWLPLGGYVKISGMIDESLDKEQMKQPPQPWEFRSKPSWQRLIIMIAGVTMNLILAVVIYIAMLAVWGEQYLPTKNVKYGITCDSLAVEMGLRDGDKILSVDNNYIDDFAKIPAEIIFESAKTIQVERDGKKENVVIPENFVAKLLKKKTPDFIGLRYPFIVGGFGNNSVAEKAGMKVNDRIIGIEQTYVDYFDQFRKEIVKYKNKDINVLVQRGSDTLALAMKVTPEGMIGVRTVDVTSLFQLQKHEYNVLQAIPAGAVKAYKAVGNYLKQLKLLFSPETKAYESLGGFIAIGNIFPSEWDWQSFWGLTAFLSIILAIMNLLPIPALDGGHVLFLLYEIISGRKPSDKFLEYAQYIGMILLLALLVFANGNDIWKLFK